MGLTTYLWIALGGALGSVGRAWLASTVALLTGPQFPWGTILINVVGSFAIGFFGTLTSVIDGRYPLPTDARAFVMIGICGGFTTFSSFSLQTLELARDGRGTQAAANVALSVVLCLASVAAGYTAAAMLNRGTAIESPTNPPSVRK
jgi:CrcB protein